MHENKLISGCIGEFTVWNTASETYPAYESFINRYIHQPSTTPNLQKLAYYGTDFDKNDSCWY